MMLHDWRRVVGGGGAFGGLGMWGIPGEGREMAGVGKRISLAARELDAALSQLFVLK